MHRPTSDIAFTPAVKAQQTARGSRGGYARMEQDRGWSDSVDEQLAAFIAARDSFYFATSNAEGQPYIQHRGGPPGFLRVLDARTLGFADFTGNKQFITLGNLSENPRAFLFLMDYPNRQRVKIWGNARVEESNPEILARCAEGPAAPVPDRAILFDVAAWDANCPKHITPRFSEAQVAPLVDALRQRIEALEAEVAALRNSHKDG